MTDEEKFEEILRELGGLLLDLEALCTKTVLIGGQVLALESRRRGGTGVIAITTDTGTVIERGFSFEPDLLFDLDGTEFMAERLPEILKLRGYQRTRDFRWSKPLQGDEWMHLDLFAPKGVDPRQLPTSMTLLPDAWLALRRSQQVSLPVGETCLNILLPDPVAFLAMKVRAKREQRPTEVKDCFDIFAYVKLIGPAEVIASLERAGQEGKMLRAMLIDLFRDSSAPGVQDVLAHAPSLEKEEQELLAQAVVDLFSEF